MAQVDSLLIIKTFYFRLTSNGINSLVTQNDFINLKFFQEMWVKNGKNSVTFTLITFIVNHIYFDTTWLSH